MKKLILALFVAIESLAFCDVAIEQFEDPLVTLFQYALDKKLYFEKEAQNTPITQYYIIYKAKADAYSDIMNYISPDQ